MLIGITTKTLSGCPHCGLPSAAKGRNMRRIFILFMVTVVVLSISATSSEAAGNEAILPKGEKAPIYLENYARPSTVIGYINKGAAIQPAGSAGAHWKVRYGNGYGYVLKKQVQFRSHSREAFTQPLQSKNQIITQRSTPVYVKKKGKNIAIGSIAKNMRYPVEKQTGKEYLINFGARKAFISKNHVEADKGVPVLMYHHLLTDEENKNYRTNSTIPVDQFSEEMKWLRLNGYKSITMQELEAYMKGRGVLPAKAVVITFDDGLKSAFHYAYPILKENRLKATNFIITSRIEDQESKFDPDRLQFLSSREMNAMTDIFKYGGHTHAMHSMLFSRGYLVIKSLQEVRTDLVKNINLLHTRYLAYPYGQTNNQVTALMKELDYSLAFTIAPGYATPHDDPYRIPRFGISPGMPLEEFKSIMEGNYSKNRTIVTVK